MEDAWPTWLKVMENGSVGEDDIEFPWALPLPNPIGDIPKMFVEQKEELRKIVFDMEEVLGAIDAVLTEKDPRRALELMDDLRGHVDGYGRITFGSNTDFHWGDFPNALDTHDRWRNGLQADGLFRALHLNERPLADSARLSNDCASSDRER